MYVMGARFETLAAANAALQEVRHAAAVAPGDVAVRPLGSMQYEAPSTGFVLGGRFADGDVQNVRRILEAHGGSMIVCRPDTPTIAAGAAVNRAAVASNPPWTGSWTAASPATSRARAPKAKAGPWLRKRLRRPVARLRGRAARVHRLADRRQ